MVWGPLVTRGLHWPGGSQQGLSQHVPAGVQASAKHEGLTLRRRKLERSMSVFQGRVWEDSGQKICLGPTPPCLCPHSLVVPPLSLCLPRVWRPACVLSPASRLGHLTWKGHPKQACCQASNPESKLCVCPETVRQRSLGENDSDPFLVKKCRLCHRLYYGTSNFHI